MAIIEKLQKAGGYIIGEDMSHPEFSTKMNDLLRKGISSNVYRSYFTNTQNISKNVSAYKSKWPNAKSLKNMYNYKTNRNTCKKLKETALFTNTKGAYSYISSLKTSEKTKLIYDSITNELTPIAIIISDYINLNNVQQGNVQRNTIQNSNFRCKPVILTLMELYIPFLYVLDTITILATSAWTELLNTKHVICALKKYLGNGCDFPLFIIIPKNMTLLFRPDGSPRVTIQEIWMVLHIVDPALDYTILGFNTVWIICVRRSEIKRITETT